MGNGKYGSMNRMCCEVTEKAFNLAEEPWVQVMEQDCSVKEVSLTDAIRNAHSYRALAGEMEAQNIAVLRLLIAIAHTIFTRNNPDGEEDAVEDVQSAVQRWEELKKNGCFPEKPVLSYFSRWHERFWLFHPQFPFYQVPDASTGTENTSAKLNGEVSESNNKKRLFSSLSGDGKKDMSFPESARWLLFINAFDDCAAKQQDKDMVHRTMPIAWLGKLGLIEATGDNLFETILLNMPMLTDDGELWEEDDIPVWELPSPCAEERRTIAAPRNPAGLLTLQSRRLLLIRNGERVSGYRVLGGDSFSEENVFTEQMTLWKRVEDKKNHTYVFLPRRHDRTRQVWRDFGAMVNIGENDHRPGVVSWCGYLQKKNLIERNRLISFRIVSVRYDSNQFSSITDSFSDAISFHADLLTEAGKIWVREINHQLGLIDKAADEIRDLAVKLAKASGQDEKKWNDAGNAPREQFFLSVDLPFRDWLAILTSAQDSDERNSLISQWQKTVRQIALVLGRQLVDEKGDIAFIGRKVTEKKKEYHYSSPEAYSWFQYQMFHIYPES